MTIIKSYTSLEQSKMLAEFLPLESADMNWHELPSIGLFVRAFPYKQDNGATEGLYPCWSLAALLSVLPIVYTNNKKEVCGPLHIDITDSETPFVLWYVNPLHKGDIVELQTKEYDNLVDACVEMLVKLNKKKLL